VIQKVGAELYRQAQQAQKEKPKEKGEDKKPEAEEGEFKEKKS